MLRVMAVVMVMSAGAGCTARQLRIVNAVTLSASTATLACDWGQTHRAAANDWMWYRDGHPVSHEESNPFLGPHPTTIQVGMYFGTAALVNATVWATMPERFRSVAPTLIVARQLLAIYRNTSSLGVCGAR